MAAFSSSFFLNYNSSAIFLSASSLAILSSVAFFSVASLWAVILSSKSFLVWAAFLISASKLF